MGKGTGLARFRLAHLGLLIAATLVASVPAWAATTLSDGKVEPTTGDTTTPFEYSVVYTSTDNIAPIAALVIIDDRTTLPMKPELGSTLAEGVRYVRTTRLPVGAHRYRFVFLISAANASATADRPPRDVTRIYFPDTDPPTSLDGPTVTAAELYIAGVVKGQSGPLKGVKITAAQRGGSVLETTTAADGTYKLSGLTRGVYVVKAEDPTGTTSFLPPAHVVLVPPSRDGVNFRAVAPSTVTGYVRERGGEPIVGAEVRLRPLRAEVQAQALTTTTDEEGRYAFEGLAPGRYVVSVSLEGYWFRPPARVVSVPPSKEDVSFVGVGQGIIAGLVHSPRRQPIPNAQVTLESRSADTVELVMTTTTDEQGRYKFTGVTPGRYVVSASKDGFHFVPQTYRLRVPPSHLAVNFLGLKAPLGSLTNGTVSPTSGPLGTTFRYSVVYTHPDNIAPTLAGLEIDAGIPVRMTKDPADDDFTDGVEYTYETSDLSIGEHVFKFVFAYKEDGRTFVLCDPKRGVHEGPTVTEASP